MRCFHGLSRKPCPRSLRDASNDSTRAAGRFPQDQPPAARAAQPVDNDKSQPTNSQFRELLLARQASGKFHDKSINAAANYPSIYVLTLSQTTKELKLYFVFNV
jgi:hypothetical protein